MENNEDHRLKNIVLAKHLNEKKIELRERKKNIHSLETQVRSQKLKNSKLEYSQLTVLDGINRFKRQLDETFIQNTIGYISLSEQIEQLQSQTAQNPNQSGSIGGFNSSFDASKSSFHSKVTFSNYSLNSSGLLNKNIPITNTSSCDGFDSSFENNINASNIFPINATSNDSVFDTTFIEDDVDVKMYSSEKIQKKSRKRTKTTSIKKVKNESFKTSSTCTDQQSSSNCSILSSRGRLIKKVNYSEDAQAINSRFKYYFGDIFG